MRTRRHAAPRRIFAICVAASALLGCLSIGEPFPADRVAQIQVDQTTRAQIQELFGPPWRTGLESGMPTWTYAHYRYGAFGGTQTRDLVVRFDERGIVDSYTFNSTYSEDAPPSSSRH